MSNRLWRTSAALSLLVAVALAACSGTSQNNGDQGAGGTVALSSFEATDLNGDSFTLGDHLGKDVVLISFWATYCEPCKAEMPVLQTMHDELGPKGLKILSVALDGPDTMSGVAPYIRSNGYTFTVVIDEDTSIAQAYNPRATAPFTVMIDRRGKVHKTVEGFQVSEAPELRKEVEHLLAAK